MEGDCTGSEFCRQRAKSFSRGPYTSVGIVTRLRAGLSKNYGKVQKFISSVGIKKGSGANTTS